MKVNNYASKQGYLDFINSQKTLMISSLDKDGMPFISYSTFVIYDQKIYIYISPAADHYEFITKRPTIDIMIINDQSATDNLFARIRARFPCTAINIGNQAVTDTDNHEAIFDRFNDNYGTETMNMLRQMDLTLFELTPGQGRYVAGFAAAYDLSFDGSDFELIVAENAHGKK